MDFKRISNSKLYVEAIVVGLSSMIVGPLLKIKNTTVMFFVLGFVLHLIYEFLGINRWYCKSFVL